MPNSKGKTGAGGIVEQLTEWQRLEDAFHDALPDQGDTGDGGVAGGALCQFLYDNADEFRTLLTSQQSEIARLTQEVEAAREALEPFAKMGAMLDGPFAPALFRDDQAIGMGGAWSENGEPRTITFGDLRKARATLTGHPTKEPGNVD